MRRVREARGMSGEALGRAAGYSKSYVSKVESGAVTPSLKYAQGCDKAFGTGDLFTRQLKRLIHGDHPAWFAAYVDAEHEADTIRDFSAVLVMGLLQTEDYARAVFRSAWVPYSDEEVEANVASRLKRREILDSADPPRLWVVLHEACLWAQVGSPRVMADQLAHLINAVGEHPTLTVQVLPNTAAAVTISTPFTLLEAAEHGPVVYAEGPQGGRPYDTTAVIDNAVACFDQLRACSLSPQDSLEYLGKVRNEYARNAVDQVHLQRFASRPVRRVGPGARVRQQRRPRPGQ
ncbi:helix-turn-helix transcriptional regulator [Streptomyces sp. HNM0574]|nr:helix-turn-helix transcriptional regulator [Streptomyces sp. HNM0574]